MKKVLAFLLTVALLFSMGNGFAVAQETSPKILVDGVKDDAYTRWNMLDHSYWGFYCQDEKHTTEPVDPQRVKNTLWFDWDEDYIYLYFQAQNHPQCGGPLYKPSENELTPPTDGTFFEKILICLDTAPSAYYKAYCTLPHIAIPEKSTCDHFCCNTVTGEGASHRFMATFVPAFNTCAPYNSSEDCQWATFIDYQTNTYGVELKYPRKAGETYFQLNVTNYVSEKDDWPEDAPEMGYSQSFCGTPRTNADELLEIYYDEYPDAPTPEDYTAAQPVIDLLNTIPSSLTIEDKPFIEQCRNAFNKLTPTQRSLVENFEKLENAEQQLTLLNVEWLISQLPKEITQENKHLVTQAQNEFYKLTYAQQLTIKNRNDLEKADGEKRTLDVIESLNNLPKIITLNHAETISQIRSSYTFLPTANKSKVTNYNTLYCAEQTLSVLKSNHYGNVDLDALFSVNAKDALLVLRYCVGKETFSFQQEVLAEVDGTFGITAKDALEILKFSVGKIQAFPVESPA